MLTLSVVALMLNCSIVVFMVVLVEPLFMSM